MAIPRWAPGTLYQPGDVVQRRSALPVVQDAPTNPSFEDGGTGWTFDGNWVVSGVVPGVIPAGFNGANCVALNGAFIGTSYVVNNNRVPVVPGQVINASCYINGTGQLNTGRQAMSCALIWYDVDGNVITISSGQQQFITAFNWAQATVAAAAPSGAVTVAIAGRGQRNLDAYALCFDAFSWDYTFSEPADGLVFRAVQANAGYSAVSEPVWPTIEGGQVVDNEVTWEAFLAASLTWQATSILISGSVEPDWPDSMNAAVVDNTISWVATTGQVTDVKCPNTIPVAIAASKVFAGDDDIIAFSATVNPLDWTTKNDAGYLPFGLQTYGGTPLTALGLYRSNLVAFNAQAFQMWQVDPDPASMAFLDAIPIGCTYQQTVQPWNNDLIFLSKVGFRNVGIAGASTNLQTEGVGEPIDSLTTAKIRAGLYEPFSLTYPATGQYWGVFGDEAFILTVNGVKKKSWSRYTFPTPLTDWTIHGSDLFMRAGDKVWRLDESLKYDDVVDPEAEFTLGGAAGGEMTAGEVEYDVVETGFFADGFGEFDGTLSELDDSQGLTLIGAWNIFSYDDDTNDLLVVIEGDDTAPDQDLFVSLMFTDLEGVEQELLSASASYSTNGNQASWSFSMDYNPFESGGRYALTFTTTSAYVGYDPFHDTGSLASTTLVDHSVLLAARNVSADRFELYLSSIFGDGATAFESVAIYDSQDILTANLLARYYVSDSSHNNVGSVTLDAVVYPAVEVYRWDEENPFTNQEAFAIVLEGFTAEQVGEDINGIIQWPHLDMGNMGVEKNLVGLDLVADAPTGVSVSIGYNQRDLTARTAPYAVDPDTLDGKLVPIPVSGPSFDLKLTFEPGQTWEFFAANLYVNDNRVGS